MDCGYLWIGEQVKNAHADARAQLWHVSATRGPSWEILEEGSMYYYWTHSQ
jgi:hypothetical protein